MTDPKTHANCCGEARTEEPLICFQNVSFGYGESFAVQDADFDIFRGESVCVIGPNGGGKSTLLKLILGLLRPSLGEITVFGDRPEQARARIGYVPQQIDFDPLFPVSALEVVLMGRLTSKSFGFRSKRDVALSMEALDRMGLADRAKAPFSSLSGGLRQAVLIARALATQCQVLLLDEPTAHVDVAAEARLAVSLKSLQDELTLVTVSHDLAFVTRSVPKVLCVNRCVHVHPTADLTEDRIRNLFGQDVRLVQHDHEHLDSHAGHQH